MAISSFLPKFRRGMEFWGMLVLCATLAACGRQAPTGGVLPAGTPVLAFGDSVTYGVGARQGDDWPSLLAKKTGWFIENAGVSGDTALRAKERLPEALARFRPKLVLLELGGNDFLRRRGQAEVKEDLREMIRLAKASGAQVVLIAVPAFSLLAVVAQHPSDAPIYAELAHEENVLLVADVFSDVLGEDNLRADRIHPNATGYAQMAQGIWQALRQQGIAP
jgi:acyl-CoA hydrolase